MDKLDDRVTNIAVEAVVVELDTCDVRQNKAFIKGALRSALHVFLVVILNNLSGNGKIFENAVIQEAAGAKLLAITASAVARDTAAVTPISWYTAKIVKKEVEESMKDLVLSLHSSPLSGLSSSREEIFKSHMVRSSEKKSRRRKLSVFSTYKSTSSLKRLLKETTKSSKLPTKSLMPKTDHLI